MNTQFSNRLVALRRERGMTQSDLAKALKKSRSAISGYEIEGKEPDYTSLIAIARFFGVSTDFLLGLSNENTRSEVVFVDDSHNIKAHYNALPAESKAFVSKAYGCFYNLLFRDVKADNIEHLELYRELLSVLSSKRSRIRRSVDSCGGKVTDPLLLSELMNSQNNLKNEVSTILDKLLQADIDEAFEVKKGGTELSDKVAT